MSTHEHPVCGRCGVYRHLHPTKTCVKSRRSYWWDEHLLWRHIVVPAWWALSDRARWRIVGAIFDHSRKRVCWCDLVDTVIHAQDDRRDDYRGTNGCPCDAPLPWPTRTPGNCYCPPEDPR